MTARKTIACAVDGGASAEAVRYAANLARELAAELVLVHVEKKPLPDEGPPPSPEEAAKRRIENAKWTALASGIRGEDVRLQLATGPVADGLIDFAQRSRCDVLVLATRARGPLTYAAGSAVGRVLAHAPCPVLVVPAAIEDVGPDYPGQVA